LHYETEQLAVRQRTDRERLIVRYLLGEMTDEERARVEERFFLDPDYLEELHALEEELIRDYLQGRLSDRERKGIEVVYLDSPHLSRRVEFSSSLIGHLSRERIAPRENRLSLWQSLLASVRLQKPAVRISLAAASIILLVAAPALLVQTVRLSNTLDRAQSERAALKENEQELQRQLDERRLRADRLREQLEREERERGLLEDELVRLKQRQSIIASLVISGGSVRGAGAPKKLVIQPEAKLVRLELIVTSLVEYASYAVHLKMVGGDYIPAQSAPRVKRTASGKIVILSLAADLFATADYTLTLAGVGASGAKENVEDYSFSVVKR